MGLGVHLGEGAVGAPLVRTMSKMKGEPRVRALRGHEVYLFEVMCAGCGIEWKWTKSQGGRGK